MLKLKQICMIAKKERSFLYPSNQPSSSRINSFPIPQRLQHLPRRAHTPTIPIQRRDQRAVHARKFSLQDFLISICVRDVRVGLVVLHCFVLFATVGEGGEDRFCGLLGLVLLVVAVRGGVGLLLVLVVRGGVGLLGVVLLVLLLLGVVLLVVLLLLLLGVVWLVKLLLRRGPGGRGVLFVSGGRVLGERIVGVVVVGV